MAEYDNRVPVRPSKASNLRFALQELRSALREADTLREMRVAVREIERLLLYAGAAEEPKPDEE